MVAALPQQSAHYDQLETVLHSDDRDNAAHHVALGEFIAEVEVESEWEEDGPSDFAPSWSFCWEPIPGYTLPRHVVWASRDFRSRPLGYHGVKIYLLHRVLRI